MQSQPQHHYAGNDEQVHEIQLSDNDGELVATDDIELDSEGEELLGDGEEGDPYTYQQYQQHLQQMQAAGAAPLPPPANGGGGGLQLDEATHAAVQALGGFMAPVQPGQTVEIPDENGTIMHFPPDHHEYQAAVQHHNQQVNAANQAILAQAQQQTQGMLEPAVTVDDGEHFAQKYMQDLGQDIESFTVYKWRITNYRKQDKRMSSPEFECGGHKW